MSVDYDPFGNIISGTLVGEYGFSTKPLIDDLDWYYYGFRYYDPQTGRWPSRDPIGENWETAEFNVYAFVRNDSLSWVDLLGQEISPSEFDKWGGQRGMNRKESMGNCWRYAADDPAKPGEPHSPMPDGWKPEGDIFQDPKGKKNCKSLMEAVQSQGGSAPSGGSCPDCHDLITVQYSDGISDGNRIRQDAHFGGGGGWSDKRGNTPPTSLPNSNARPGYIKCGEWCLPKGTDTD